MHGSHDCSRIAGWDRNHHIRPCRCDAVPLLLPGTPTATPDRTPLLLPGARSIGKWRFLLPRPFATTFDLGLGPDLPAPSSDGAFFLVRPLSPLRARPAGRRLQKMHGSRSEAAFVRRDAWVDNCSRQFAASPPPWPRWSGQRLGAGLKAPLIPSSGVFLFGAIA